MKLTTFRAGENDEVHIDVYVSAGEVRVEDVTIGSGPGKFLGDSVDRDYERIIRVKAEDLGGLLAALGHRGPASDEKVAELIARQFAGITRSSLFEDFLKEHDVRFDIFAW